MKLLLHICCAPCSIFPVEELSKDPSTDIRGFYYNPNIHPIGEYLNRRGALEKYAARTGLDAQFPEYKPEDFFSSIKENETRPKRCELCYKLRLEKTASYARDNGFGAFSSTLLISPYQDHDAVKKAGVEAGRKFGMDFYYRDFRGGFRGSWNSAAAMELYRQKYCGCVYSKDESQSQKAKVKKQK